MNDVVQIGKIVRQLREDRRMSQTELASKIGWAQPAVSNLEKGRRKSVNTADLNTIALALHVKPEELLYGHGINGRTPLQSPRFIDRISEQIVHLTTFQQERVWNVVAEVIAAISQ